MTQLGMAIARSGHPTAGDPRGPGVAFSLSSETETDHGVGGRLPGG
jgi:hypothetical protein